MVKKNYLSIGEQEIWQYIKDKGIVDNELIREIYPEFSPNKSNKILHGLFKKGYLKRAKKDMYFNPEKLQSYYILALKIKGGYIGLNSALRHYNLIEYEDFTIFVMTKSFQKNMVLPGTQYTIRFIPLKSLFTGFEKREKIYISSIEKTLFDCFLMPKFIGFANITKAVYDANNDHKFDWKRFISFFDIANNNALYQRTGYILELMKNVTKQHIPDYVLRYFKERVKNPVKLMPSNNKSKFNKYWKIQDNLGEENILSWWH